MEQELEAVEPIVEPTLHEQYTTVDVKMLCGLAWVTSTKKSVAEQVATALGQTQEKQVAKQVSDAIADITEKVFAGNFSNIKHFKEAIGTLAELTERAKDAKKGVNAQRKRIKENHRPIYDEIKLGTALVSKLHSRKMEILSQLGLKVEARPPLDLIVK